MSESWVEKHRPEHYSQIQGNNKDIDELKEWVRNFTSGDEAQLLVGPPGVGKTTTAYVISKKMGYPLNEINASDSRGSEGIREIAESIDTSPTNADYQLILVDEVDSQHHATNKQPLYSALESPRNPVILTANDEYDVPQAIRNRVNVREFSLSKRSRKAKLKKIAKAEDLDISEKDLEKLAERPGLRSAIHDLQLWAEQDIPPGMDNRQWDIGKFDVMDKILRGEKESGQMSPPDLIMWLDENLSRDYRGVEAAVAYDTLSRADKWLKRAEKEDYRWWKYAGELAEQTATQRLTEPYEGYIKKDFPEWFRHSMPTPKDDSPEAHLFRELKGLEVIRDKGRKRLTNSKAGFQMAGSFTQFRKDILPILQDLEVEEKLQIAKRYKLNNKAMKALELPKKTYKDWNEQDVPEERQQDENDLKQTDALSW